MFRIRIAGCHSPNSSIGMFCEICDHLSLFARKQSVWSPTRYGAVSFFIFRRALRCDQSESIWDLNCDVLLYVRLRLIQSLARLLGCLLKALKVINFLEKALFLNSNVFLASPSKNVSLNLALEFFLLSLQIYYLLVMKWWQNTYCNRRGRFHYIVL